MKSLKEHLNESLIINEANNENGGQITLDWATDAKETQELFDLCFANHGISFREKPRGEMEFTWSNKKDFIRLMGYLVATYSPHEEFLTFSTEDDDDASLAFYLPKPLFKVASKFENEIIDLANHASRKLQ
jgi:hypothetical protein